MNDFLKSNLFDTERTALCTCTSFAFKTVCVKKGLNNIILPKICLWQERLLKMNDNINIVDTCTVQANGL